MVRAHLRRLELVALVSEGGHCTTCGELHPPAELRLRCQSIGPLRPLARWTRVIRLVAAHQAGNRVEALCQRCEGRLCAAIGRCD